MSQDGDTVQALPSPPPRAFGRLREMMGANKEGAEKFGELNGKPGDQ